MIGRFVYRVPDTDRHSGLQSIGAEVLALVDDHYIWKVACLRRKGQPAGHFVRALKMNPLPANGSLMKRCTTGRLISINLQHSNPLTAISFVIEAAFHSGLLYSLDAKQAALSFFEHHNEDLLNQAQGRMRRPVPASLPCAGALRSKMRHFTPY